MEILLRNIGNSKGFVVPSHLLKQLDIQVGDKLTIVVEEGKLVISPNTKRPKYKLDDLLAKCDISAPMPQELFEWDDFPLVENEI